MEDSGNDKYVLLRIDDVGHDSQENQLFIDILFDRGVPCSCGVVPDWLTKEVGNHLKSLHLIDSQLIEVHQHGYLHVNYNLEGRNGKYEFGALRTYEEQYSDIQKGRELLERELGELFFPVFSPPFGGFDETCLRILRELEFSYLTSLGWGPSSKAVTDIPGLVDCFNWSPRKEKDLAEIQEEIIGYRNNELVVVVFHPQFMTKETIINTLRGLDLILQGRQILTYRAATESVCYS